MPPRLYKLIGKTSMILGLVILPIAGRLWAWTQYNRLAAEEQAASTQQICY